MLLLRTLSALATGGLFALFLTSTPLLQSFGAS